MAVAPPIRDACAELNAMHGAAGHQQHGAPRVREHDDAQLRDVDWTSLARAGQDKSHRHINP